MTDHDPILAKVRKLLALAEDPAATEHESRTYTACLSPGVRPSASTRPRPPS